MGAPHVETGVPLPQRKVRDPASYRPGLFGPRRQATVAIRELAKAEIGASVFVEDGTYACEPEGIRTAALRAGGAGWYTIRPVPGGWRCWKLSPCVARAAT